MNKLDELRKRLVPGKVYRRADLAKWSNAVDRHLQQLVKAGALERLSGGVYYSPYIVSFGKTLPSDRELVEAFLKDRRFLITSRNAYNALGVGTTQLYNETVVYNHKRHGKIRLGKRTFDFRIKPHFPYIASKEFLLVDLVNNIETLAEDREAVLERVAKKARRMNPRAMREAVKRYAGVRARKFFGEVLP